MVTVTKGDPDAPLPVLMKMEGAAKIRAALGSYVDYLKTGEPMHVVRLGQTLFLGLGRFLC